MLRINLQHKSYSINLDYYILLLMFLLIPFDMINGVLLMNNIELPISFGQTHKFLIILLIIFRLLTKPRLLLFFICLVLVLLIPSLVQLFKDFQSSILLKDIIKIFRYLTPVLSFMFFVNIYKSENDYLQKKIFLFIKLSFILLSISILIKYLGIGYPMYNYGNIGSKGLFYAGNEISALLLVLSSFLGIHYWKWNSRKKYFLLFIISFITGLAIGSKTAFIGVLLIFFLIPQKKISKQTKLTKFIYTILGIGLVTPVLLFISWEFIKRTELYVRLIYFYDKLDFITFLLSNRNTFLLDAVNVYINDYSWLEKLIGVGQSTFENRNNNSIIEIDFIDIFFAYGLLGLLIFVGIIVFLWKQSKRFAKSEKYPYANFVNMMLLVLLAVSSSAGHVFSSGLAAVFIGLLFGLMYKSKVDV
nr:O-antigen ligase family protein [Psychroflexus planctonicus]